jgi:hypothetical protein
LNMQKGDEPSPQTFGGAPRAERGGKSEPRGRKKGDREKDEDGVAAKPSGKVSLFDFLEDKLPIREYQKSVYAIEYTNTNITEKEVERKSSSNNHFVDRRGHYNSGEGGRGGGGGGGRGGSRYQDGNQWGSRQNERAGQKPPRFQQQAQRLQQRQQGGPNKSLDAPYSTWSNAAPNNDFHGHWGSFSGLANDPKDLFRR